MIHIKDLEFKRTEKVEDVLNIGDWTWVKVTGIDERGPRQPQPQGSPQGTRGHGPQGLRAPQS